VLIPSIDLMDGRIVQLVQGKKKALEFENFAEWVERFARYPMVQLIDLDAAMGKGDNRALIAEFCGKLPCQVGGGIRTAKDAQQMFGGQRICRQTERRAWGGEVGDGDRLAWRTSGDSRVEDHYRNCTRRDDADVGAVLLCVSLYAH
jgi:Histidine biosynthesis protein